MASILDPNDEIWTETCLKCGSSYNEPFISSCKCHAEIWYRKDIREALDKIPKKENKKCPLVLSQNKKT